MSSSNENELYQEAQKRLVASLLNGDDDAVQALENLSEEDFEEPQYALIFVSVAELVREGSPVSIITVAEKLEAGGALSKAGGAAELYKLKNEGEDYLTEAPITVYSRIVREYSSKKKIKDLLRESSSEFQADSGVLASDGVSKLQSDLNEVLYKLSDTETVTTAEELSNTYIGLLDERERISKENMESAGGLQGIPSLLPTLNEYTTGWLNGQMITVGAQTGIGKSIFAVNCAVAAAKANKSVLHFSLEMGQDEVYNRIVSSTTGVPLNHLKQGATEDGERERIKKGLDDLKDLKLTIDTEPKLTVDMIRARALKQLQSPTGLDMIIIDYLQLLTPSRKANSRQEVVADISREIKLLAKSLEVPILIVAQLTRPHKDQEDTTPSKYDIRESGAIANDSDIVILIHRDETEKGVIPHTKIILDKNRDGVSNKTILCHSDLECSVFREVKMSEQVRMTEKDLENLDDDLEDLDDDDLDNLGDNDFDDSNDDLDF